MTTFFVILALLGIVSIGGWIMIARFKKKKQTKQKVQKVQSEPGFHKVIPVPAEVPRISVFDKQKFDKFVSEYDDGSLKFPNVKYRIGARITGKFGLAQGYRIVNNKMIWGYVRMHSGVDRAGGKEYKGIKDIVICPFDFHRTALNDYGDRSYGTLIQLFQDEYEFELRVAHMDPKKDIITWSLGELKAGRPFKRNWYLGKAGTYGASTGDHTHTEIKSYDEKCEVLEILLEELFGDAIYKEFTTSTVKNFYKKQPKFQNASDREILNDWAEIKKIKKVTFANKYLFRYIDFDGKPKTRYSTELLFHGL